MKLIDKDALVAEIERLYEGHVSKEYRDEAALVLEDLEDFIDTLEVKEVDLKLIIGWFNHIAQIADDRKTLNGVVMEDWAALDEIKCLARNSAEFIKMHYITQK